jgi:hypothetical protein
MSGLQVTGGSPSFYVSRDGKDVLGPYYREDAAHAAMDVLKRKERQKKRPCITCQTSFMSEGPHNRMCDDCRRKT